MVSLDIYNSIALICVLIFGIPHGGFDAAIARKRGWPQSFNYYVLFHIYYILISLSVIFIWFLHPLFFLTIFLILSGIHFGLSDIKHRQSMDLISIIAHGSLIPIVIPYCSQAEVNSFFAVLVGSQNSLILLQWINYLVLPWFIVMIIYSYRVFSKKRYMYDYISLLFLLLLAFLLPPIITFSIYFCFFHSPRHIKLTLKEIPFMDKRRSFYEASSYSLIAILGMLYFYNYILGHYTNSERSLLIIFIGLAALTVPHMILVDYIKHKSFVERNV